MTLPIRAIIGLGNPGPNYASHRHNIGFRILDTLAAELGASWNTGKNAATAEVITPDGHQVLLVKPLTGMNKSGDCLPLLKKQGIEAPDTLLVYDDLELPFGTLALKLGGSAKGHNGVRSMITAQGDQSYRLRFGIGRPERREDVPEYVLSPFLEPISQLTQHIAAATQRALAWLYSMD